MDESEDPENEHKPAQYEDARGIIEAIIAARLLK
jgi:hypothetical protein